MQVLRIIFSVFYSISSIIIIDHFPLLKFPFLLLCAIVLNRLLVNFSIICNYVLLTFVYTFKANDFSHGCAFSFSTLYHFPVQLPSLVLILKLHIPFQMINPLVMISDCILTDFCISCFIGLLLWRTTLSPSVCPFSPFQWHSYLIVIPNLSGYYYLNSLTPSLLIFSNILLNSQDSNFSLSLILLYLLSLDDSFLSYSFGHKLMNSKSL